MNNVSRNVYNLFGTTGAKEKRCVRETATKRKVVLPWGKNTENRSHPWFCFFASLSTCSGPTVG